MPKLNISFILIIFSSSPGFVDESILDSSTPFILSSFSRKAIWIAKDSNNNSKLTLSSKRVPTVILISSVFEIKIVTLKCWDRYSYF